MTFYLLVKIVSTNDNKSTTVYLSNISQKRKDELGDAGLGPSVEKRKIYLVDEYGIPHKWKEWEYVEYIPLKVRKYCMVLIKDKSNAIHECIKRAKKFIKVYSNINIECDNSIEMYDEK